MPENYQYEVYYKIKESGYQYRDDVPQKGKVLIKKASDKFDAKEKALNQLTDGYNINSMDIEIEDVIFWDHRYD